MPSSYCGNFYLIMIKMKSLQPPEYVDAWKNIYQATQEKNICLQRNPANGFPMGNEDCLYLNVYTPKVIGSCQKSLLYYLFNIFYFNTGRSD